MIKYINISEILSTLKFHTKRKNIEDLCEDKHKISHAHKFNTKKTNYEHQHKISKTIPIRKKKTV